MRFVATMFLWLVTTVAACGGGARRCGRSGMWSSEDGYAALAATAAHDPTLQQRDGLGVDDADHRTSPPNNGYGTSTPNSCAASSRPTPATTDSPVSSRRPTESRIAGCSPTRFASEDGSGDRWLVDIAPMLNDSSIKQTLGDLDLDVPQTLTVPITVPETSALRPGQLRTLSTWGPWVSVGSTILAGVFALLMLAAARSRGKALAALGVSALLVGAGRLGGAGGGRGATSTTR